MFLVNGTLIYNPIVYNPIYRSITVSVDVLIHLVVICIYLIVQYKLHVRGFLVSSKSRVRDSDL